MIELFFWPTPNGMKPLVFLEESGLDYRISPVNIGAGEQFGSEFLEISPNNRIPAIIDHAPADGAAPVSVFESGAILLYLGEKTGQFLPGGLRQRVPVFEWLMWQMGGLGPMLGQNHHFNRYAPDAVPYAIKRYSDETLRLYAVLDQRLTGRAFICEEYSIADMACYPWVSRFEWHKTDIDRFPEAKRWYQAIRSRPAVQAAYHRAKEVRANATVTPESSKILFGQTDATVRQGAVAASNQAADPAKD